MSLLPGEVGSSPRIVDIPQNRGGMHYEPPDPLVTPRRRENMVGLPADADYPLVCEPVYEPGVGASTWKGHALLLRARRSEFRFPRPMPPGSPPLESVGSVGGQTN